MCASTSPGRSSKMHRTFIKILAVIGFLFLGSPFAFAQTGHFVLLSQGNLASTTSYYTGDLVWSVRLGNGWNGTTTGAFGSASFHKNLGTDDNIIITLVGFTNSSYSVSTELCRYGSSGIATGFYSATSSNPFVQLAFEAESPSGACVMKPYLYYEIDLDEGFSTFGGSSPGSVAGAQTYVPPTGWTVNTQPYPPFFPYFSIVANGFQITPTASSSGLFLSGAQEYCNNEFGSSTSFGSYIGQGLCIGLGYLFIPTAQSVQDFQNIPAVIGATPPLSWFGQIRTILSNAEASSTDNFINLSINFGTTTAVLGISTLDVISTTTMSRYLPEDTRASIKLLIGASFFLLAGALIYTQVRGLWNSA